MYNLEDVDPATGLKEPKMKVKPISLDIDENNVHPECPCKLFHFLKGD